MRIAATDRAIRSRLASDEKADGDDGGFSLSGFVSNDTCAAWPLLAPAKFRFQLMSTAVSTNVSGAFLGCANHGDGVGDISGNGGGVSRRVRRTVSHLDEGTPRTPDPATPRPGRRRAIPSRWKLSLSSFWPFSKDSGWHRMASCVAGATSTDADHGLSGLSEQFFVIR